MGLRDFMNSLAGLQGSSQAFAQSSQQYRQQGAQDLLTQNLPDLVKKGDYGNMAALSTASGDTKPMDSVIKDSLDAALGKFKGKQQGLTADTMIASGIPEKKARIYEKLPPDQQKEALSLWNSSQNLNLKQEGQDGRNSQYVQKQRDSLTKDYNKLQQDHSKLEQTFANVGDTFSLNTLPSDRIMLNFIARTIGQEKGRISQQELESYMAHTLKGDATSAINFAKSGDLSKLSPEQRQTFDNLFQNAKQNFDKYKTIDNQRLLSDAPANYPLLYKDGEFDTSLKQKLKAHNMDLEEQPDGTFKSTIKGATQTYSGTNEVDAGKVIAGITDPTMRQQAQAAVEHYRQIGKPIPPAILSKMQQAAGGN